MSDSEGSESYRCPETGRTFDRWQVVTVSPYGNGVFECPFCGVHKRDETGSVRESHLRNRRDQHTESDR